MSKYYAELEDVIQRLDNAIYCANRGEFDSYLEAMKRLRIAYAETMPTIEVSEDCISRKDLIESFLADNECKREEAKACMCKLDLMLELIENAPSIVPTCTDSILYLESREIVNCNDCSEYDTCEFEFIKARNGYCYLGERSEE